ncbi:MAG: CBS domain-containing protein [Alphaproteobacteria bacterium]|nr:CBS domain-containing protein [Alphaproteobacteria bacterium]
MKTIQEIFDSKGPHFNKILNNATVLDALILMKAENLSYLIVFDENDNFLGLITEKDYVRKIKLEGKKSEQTKVKEIMSIDYPIVDFGTEITNCIEILEANKVNYLIVYKSRVFYGVVTIHDLLRSILWKNKYL